MKSMSFLIIMLMSLGLATGVFSAQDSGPVFCGDLGDTDCELLMASQEAMGTLTAASFNFEMTFDFSTDDGSLAANLDAGGRYSVPAAYLEQFTPEALQTQDMVEFLNTFSELLAEINVAVGVDITVQDNLATGSNNSSIQMPGMELRLTDGIAYINPGMLGLLLGTEAEWTGFDVAGLYRELANDPTLAELGDLSEFIPQIGMTGLEDFGLLDPTFLATFVSIERADDGQIGGQPVAVFVTSIDLHALAGDTTVRDTLHDVINETLLQVQQQVEDGFGFPPSEDFTLDRAELDMALDFVAPLADSVTISATQQIDLNSNFTRATTILLDIDIDRETMRDFVDDPALAEPFAAQIELILSFSDFNDIAPVEAPEGAIIQPLDDLFPVGG